MTVRCFVRHVPGDKYLIYMACWLINQASREFYGDCEAGGSQITFSENFLKTDFHESQPLKHSKSGK